MILELEYQPQKALDVLAPRLVEPYSDEDLESAAQAWEATEGQLLMRRDEHDDFGMPNEKFFERLQNFKPNVAIKRISGDPQIFKDELKRLRDSIDDISTLPEKNAANVKARINELEDALGEAKTDFTKMRTRKQITEEAKRRYADYQQQPDFGKRVAMVRREKDNTTLQLLYKWDKSDNVRKAAFERIAEIEVTGS